MATTWHLGLYNEDQQCNSRDVRDFPRFKSRFADEVSLLVEVRRVFALLQEQGSNPGWSARSGTR